MFDFIPPVIIMKTWDKDERETEHMLVIDEKGVYSCHCCDKKVLFHDESAPFGIKGAKVIDTEIDDA